MPSLIRPTETKIVTKDGEVKVSIALELNINLNTNGGIDVTATPSVKNVEAEPAEERDKTWAIPEFGSNKKLKFGKIETIEQKE